MIGIGADGLEGGVDLAHAGSDIIEGGICLPNAVVNDGHRIFQPFIGAVRVSVFLAFFELLEFF